MKILEAENNVSYTANNACKIYIIKQVDYENKKKFEEDYASLLNNNPTNPSALINLNNASHSGEKGIRLTPLIAFDYINSLYIPYEISDAIDRPQFNNSYGHKPDFLYFLSSLQRLRNCPLLDLSKLAYIFQIDGQSESGLANILSFNVNFSVNGQSSAELVINNKDFLYNFKYFNNKEKYNYHLKSYFDTNDIIIIRYQKKNTTADNLLNSFKPAQLEYWKDPYTESETDPFTTIFTGYINDVNNSFSFNNGQQTITLNCTGPSKKLTWTRFLSNRAAASKDALSAILPMSAFINVQTQNEDGQTSIQNNEVVKNTIVRTYSGVLNIPEVKKAYETFVKTFDEKNNIRTTLEIKDLKDTIANETDTKKLEDYNKQLNQKLTTLEKTIQESRATYEKVIRDNMSKFCVSKTRKEIINGKEKDVEVSVGIRKCTFINDAKFGDIPYVFKINGTNQPAYKWTFNNWSSLFKSDFSTVYQFIKGIADYLQFNFYDDPYGTIHFSVPDMTLMHLHNEKDPNNLNQIINFAETQNTENIANVQVCEANFVYDLPLDMINTVAKDYRSIAKYGEKMMQPFSMIGLTNPAAIRYAAKMKMVKYNRKALSNIRINMNGEPCLQMDKYAYIKSLRKLFYIESYSHSYNAGGDFTTSLNGTYTRDILALANFQYDKVKVDSKITAGQNILSPLGSVTKQSTTSEFIDQTIGARLGKDYWLTSKLQNATSIEEILYILDQIVLPNKDILAQKMYQIYIDNWNYPKDDENLKYDIGAMYNKQNLKQCLLDGFFWALPFDVNPYDVALQIQEDELKAKKQLKITKSNTSSRQNQVYNTNKSITEKISSGVNSIKPTPITVDAVLVKDTSYKIDGTDFTIKSGKVINIPMKQTLELSITPSIETNPLKILEQMENKKNE